MPEVIREIGILSVGKVAGIVYACLGLVLGMLFAFISLVGGFAGLMNDAGAPAGLIALFFGVGAVFILPIVYGVIGALLGMFVCVIYNAAARAVGGIEITIESR